MSGRASTKHWARCPSSKVCSRIGSTGRPSLGVGTYQTCLWGDATTSTDPSARTARFSSMTCSGKLEAVVIFAREAVVIVVPLYSGRRCYSAASTTVNLLCYGMDHTFVLVI